MNKLALVATVLGVLGAGWAGSTGYVGQQTQATLKTQIEHANQMISQSPQLEGMKLELVDYSQSFLTAQGKVKVSLPTQLGEDVPEAVNILLDVQHGPLLWELGKPSVALARINSRLDESSFSAETQQQIKNLFNSRAPLVVDTELKFGNSADYTLVMNPLSYDNAEQGGSVNFAGFNLKGVSTLSSEQGQSILSGPLEGKIGKVEFKGADETVILLPESELKAEAKGVLGGDLISSAMDLTLPGISIKAKELPEPISFGLNLKSTSAVQNTDSEGTFSLTISDLITPVLPTSKASYSFSFNGLNTAGLKAASKAFSALEPVQNELRLLDEMNAANQTGVNSETVTTAESPTETEEPASTTPTPDAETPSESAETPSAPMAEDDTTEGVAEGETVAAIPDDQAPAETAVEEEVLVEEPPEVQAKRAELEQKQAELMSQAFDVVLTQVLQADKSRVQQNISLENKLGLAKLEADLTYVGNKDKLPINVEVLKNLEPQQMVQLVKGKINFNFDHDLFPMAALFLNQPFITKENNQYKVSLELTGDQLVLNNKPMSFDEFVALMGNVSEAGLGGADEEAPSDVETTETPSPDAEQEQELMPEATPTPTEAAPAVSPQIN